MGRQVISRMSLHPCPVKMSARIKTRRRTVASDHEHSLGPTPGIGPEYRVLPRDPKNGVSERELNGCMGISDPFVQACDRITKTSAIRSPYVIATAVGMDEPGESELSSYPER